jgi:glycosyltransferase involved in cell wall biosynthesis
VSIKIIRGAENRGLAFARNRLLEHAGTDYVHFHDSDDFFLPGWLNQVRRVIENHNKPEAVFTEVALFTNGEMQSRRLGLERLELTQDLLGFCIENMLTGAGTFDRKLLLEMGGYPESLLQPEAAFHIRLAARCNSYVLIKEPLVGIRIRSDSHSDKLYRHDLLNVYRDRLREVKLISPEIPAHYHCQLADTAIRVSRELYRLGHLEEAREGFSWAVNLCRPNYRYQPWGYRLCAKIAGPLYAEMISTIYRKLPRSVRQVIQ